MNKGTLPILARLQRMQADLLVVPGGGRIIADAKDRNPLAQLLREANETMLGRSLEFVSSAGPSLMLDVAGRRVLRLTACHGLAGAETCLGAETLEDDHKDALIKLLQALAVPRQELRVISGPIGRGGAEVSVGLPVALLADLLLIDLNEVGAPEPQMDDDTVAPAASDGRVVLLDGSGMADFATGIGSALVAWVIDGGEADGRRDGPEDMVSHLRAFLETERPSLERQLDIMASKPGEPMCLILGASLGSGHNIMCARWQSSLLLGVVDQDGAQATLSAWSALMR